MRYIVLLCASALFMISPNRISAQESTSDQSHSTVGSTLRTETVNELTRLESVWNDAHIHGNVDALDKLWSDDITVIVPQMQPFRKSELLEMWRKIPVSFERYDSEEIKIRDFGDCSILTGRINRERDFGGRQAKEQWLFTKVYRRFEDGWRVVAFHASTAPEK